jgi:hypothetical protein
MNVELATQDGFAHGDRVPRGRIEGRVDELEAPHPPLARQRCDFIGHRFRIAKSISPSFDVEVRTVDAFEHASALGLDRHRGAVALIRVKIDPILQAGLGQRIEIPFASRRNESRSLRVAPDEPWHLAGIAPR